jgi:hypothetical protein
MRHLIEPQVLARGIATKASSSSSAAITREAQLLARFAGLPG